MKMLKALGFLVAMAVFGSSTAQAACMTGPWSPGYSYFANKVLTYVANGVTSVWTATVQADGRAVTTNNLGYSDPSKRARVRTYCRSGYTGASYYVTAPFTQGIPSAKCYPGDTLYYAQTQLQNCR